MPRVVIELQANTQDAVNKIAQFAKAQRDTFDAIKAANPALAEATIKVGQLTDAYVKAGKAQRDLVQGPSPAASIKTFTQAMTDASGAVVAYGTATARQKAATAGFWQDQTAGSAKAAAAIGAFDAAGKNWIQGSLRELTGGIPILDSALTKMIGTLGGFPLAVGGVVAGGALLVKTLSDISDKASKTNTEILTLSKSIETDLQRSILQVAKIRAEGAGDAAGGLQLGAAAQIKAIKEARDAAIDAAQKELDKIPDPRGALIPISLPERMLAEAKFQTARAEVAGAAATKIFEIEQKLKFDLKALDDKRLQDENKNRDDVVTHAAEAADKQAKLLEDLATKSLAIFQGLGESFKGVTQALTLAQFVKDSTAAIETLRQAMAAGLDTTGGFAAGITALQEKMAEAIKLGYVPTVAAAKQVTAAIGAADAATRQFTATAAALRTALAVAASIKVPPVAGRAAIEPYLRLQRDAIIALAPKTGIDVPGQGIYEPWAPPPATSMPLENFQHGGIIPGHGPVPIIAHGGERIIPAGGDGAGGARVVRIEPGAIQISGTVIEQSRDWAVLVDSLGQALAARLR